MAPLQPWAPASRNLLRRGTAQQEGSTGKRRAGIHPPERSASFYGKTTTPDLQRNQTMRRPKTQPDLIAAAGGCRKITPPVEVWSRPGCSSEEVRRVVVPTKVLVNVSVQRSLGALQVMASTDWTVEQLVGAAIKQYLKEGRRTALPSTDPSAFALHYSQFSLQCLDPKEKLIGLGSRNFFLCPKPTSSGSAVSSALTSSSSTTNPASASGPNEASESDTLKASSSSCSKEVAEKASKIAIPWLRFMDFLL